MSEWLDKPTAALTFSLKDETKSTSTLSFDIPATTTASAALAAAAAIRPLIEAVTDCAVTGYNVSYGSFDADAPVPAAGSRVERKGVLQFLTAAGKKVSYQVPGIVDAAVMASGQIDRSNAAVAAFAAALVHVDAVFCDSNGHDLKSLVAAYERYTGTTSGQLPSSR